MNDWNAQALVLKVGHFREIDLWLRLLVKDKGVLTALAFGGAKSKHRFCGCLEVLNTLECRFRKSPRSPLFTLEEAQLLNGPRALRKDWSKMGIAANCLRFLEALGPENCQPQSLFSLLENLRSTLESSFNLNWLFPLLFRFHVAVLAGYALDFKHCSHCKEELQDQGAWLEVREGQLWCANCKDQFLTGAKTVVALDSGVLKLLLLVSQTLPAAWLEFSLTMKQAQTCARAIDGFIEYHLGLRWDKGSFRRI